MDRVRVPLEPEPLSAAQEVLDYIEGLKVSRYVKGSLRKLIKRLAEVDELTRCQKKEYFMHEMSKALKYSNLDQRNRDRRSTWLALWVIDIGRFKAINDNLGHLTGDAVLKRFGRILRSSIRHRQRFDLAGRMGGDEFAVLLTQLTNALGAWEAAKRFQARVRDRKWGIVNPALESTLFPRPDLGLVCLNTSSIESVDDPEEITSIGRKWYHEADQLMYRSKRSEGDIFFRCMGYDRSTQDLVEVKSDTYRLALDLVPDDRRHQ